MGTLRFTTQAEEQLQRAFALSLQPDSHVMYTRLTSALVSLENDAALFTLLEATPLPVPGDATYAVRFTLIGTWTSVAVAYQLCDSSEDITVVSLHWS